MMQKIVPMIDAAPSYEIDSCDGCTFRCAPVMPGEEPMHCDLTKGEISGDFIPEWCPLADVPTD